MLAHLSLKVVKSVWRLWLPKPGTIEKVNSSTDASWISLSGS